MSSPFCSSLSVRLRSAKGFNCFRTESNHPSPQEERRWDGEYPRAFPAFFSPRFTCLLLWLGDQGVVALHRVLGEPQLLDAVHGVISPQPGEGDIVLIIAPWGQHRHCVTAVARESPAVPCSVSCGEQNPAPSTAGWTEAPELCLTTGGHGLSFPPCCSRRGQEHTPLGMTHNVQGCWEPIAAVYMGYLCFQR